MQKLYFSMLFILSCSGAIAQSIFNNPVTGTNPNSANPYTAGQTVDANITASGIGRGSGITGSNTNNRYNAIGWNSASFDANDYFEFVLTPNAGASINFVSFAVTLQNSGTGPVNYALRSSADAYAGDIGTLTSSSTGASNTIDLSAAAYQNITTAITFRIYAWGASSGTGTFSVNDFTFNGVTSVLPVGIEYLKGTKQSNGNLLVWKVDGTNAGSSTFSVQRSNDGKNFSSLYTFSASAVTCMQPFEYTDANPMTGSNYYRVMVTDNNKIVYSNSITFLNAAKGFLVFNMQPSVVNNTSIINIGAAQKTAVQITVTDFAGNMLRQKNYMLTAGSNQVSMDFTTLNKGAYQLQVLAADGTVSCIKFMKL